MSFVLGLTGSFGSGKSTVASLLREMSGAPVIDADELAREALAPGGPLIDAVAAEFGLDLVNGGTLNRRELAHRAFSTQLGIERLNALIHPWVRERELAQLAAHASEPLTVLDVPLLFEAGMRDLCGAVAVVTISEAQRFLRLRQRGFHEADVIRRLACQMPQSRKLKLADFIIDNSGTIDETRSQVHALLGRLAGLIHGETPSQP